MAVIIPSGAEKNVETTVTATEAIKRGNTPKDGGSEVGYHSWPKRNRQTRYFPQYRDSLHEEKDQDCGEDKNGNQGGDKQDEPDRLHRFFRLPSRPPWPERGERSDMLSQPRIANQFC